jgi:Family of unknown function (DUF6339)
MNSIIELKVFTEAYIDKLYRDVKATDNVDNYYQESFPYEERFPKGTSNLFLPGDFSLDASKSDIENSILLYEQLNLSETQAADPRLWTYLSHVTFWKYMRKRWALESVRKGDNPIGRVIDRYLLVNPRLESLTRNGISRLWWYAHLTKDSNRSDNYELTRILLSRAEVAVGILERTIGVNQNMRTALLEFLQEHNEILSNEDLTRSLLRAFNLYGGTKVLPLIDVGSLKQILEYINPAA